MMKPLLGLVIDNIRNLVIDNSFSGMEFEDFLTHLETLTISIVKFKTDITANCHTIIHRHFEIPEPTGNITTLCADSKYIAWRVRKFGRQTCFFARGNYRIFWNVYRSASLLFRIFQKVDFYALNFGHSSR